MRKAMAAGNASITADPGSSETIQMNDVASRRWSKDLAIITYGKTGLSGHCRHSASLRGDTAKLPR